eukprot:IDg18945t1
MKSAIPDFQNLISALDKLMESIYHKAKKRTRRATATFLLDAMEWKNNYKMHFEICKQELAEKCTLVHGDSSKRLFIYTDANYYAWSGILSQVPQEDFLLPVSRHHHEPLAFVSEKSSSTGEAFAVTAYCNRMRW